MPIEINPPSDLQNLIRMDEYGKIKTVNLEDCIHLTQPSIYISALGKLSTCCYFGSIQWYDDVYQLLESKLDLTHNRCLESCGK
jgi:hypothetical protein